MVIFSAQVLRRNLTVSHLRLSTYSGAGSIQELGMDKATSQRMIRELREGIWITRGTRFVTLDFALYNANVNLFSVVKINFEFPPTGGIVKTASVETVKLLRYLCLG